MSLKTNSVINKILPKKTRPRSGMGWGFVSSNLFSEYIQEKIIGLDFNVSRDFEKFIKSMMEHEIEKTELKSIIEALYLLKADITNYNSGAENDFKKVIKEENKVLKFLNKIQKNVAELKISVKQSRATKGKRSPKKEVVRFSTTQSNIIREILLACKDEFSAKSITSTKTPPFDLYKKRIIKALHEYFNKEHCNMFTAKDGKQMLHSLSINLFDGYYLIKNKDNPLADRTTFNKIWKELKLY
jgi:hypothetical protein